MDQNFTDDLLNTSSEAYRKLEAELLELVCIPRIINLILLIRKHATYTISVCIPQYESLWSSTKKTNFLVTFWWRKEGHLNFAGMADLTINNPQSISLQSGNTSIEAEVINIHLMKET
jgi:hypothetical protein